MNGPPSAHPFFGLNSDGRSKRPSDPGLPSSHVAQGNSKRPRVRDYVGSRGSGGPRHLMVDFPSPSSSQQQRQQSLPQTAMSGFPFSGLTQQHLLAQVMAGSPVPSSSHTKTSREHNSNCDRTKFEGSNNTNNHSDDSAAPLDLCMKKPSREDNHDVSGTSSLDLSFASNRLNDLNRRLSEGSDGSLNSFPKKRGRKPKSLLAVPAPSSAPLPSTSAANDSNRPRKRGRPPLMSPPPNIDVTPSSSAKFGSATTAFDADKLAMISSQLQASVLAQQQLAAAQAGWPAHLLGNFMPNAIRDVFAHHLSNIQASLPQTASSRQDKQPQKTASLPVDNNDSDSGEDDIDDFKPGTNEEDIRIPLKVGWRRYTIINRVGSSGVKGTVVYISPEGKKLRTLNDIQRYLNKCGEKRYSRDNFSFSSKWFVGEFNQPSEDKTGHRMLSETDVINMVDDLKRAKRRKLLSKKKLTPQQQQQRRQQEDSSQAGPSRQRANVNEDLVRAQTAQLLQMANIRMDELKMMEMLQEIQKNQQQNLEVERRREEDAKKAAARAREMEMKRQQEEQLQKEQELQKRREQQMLIEIERERKRQHMLMVRNLDLHRKLEEREKRREEMMAEKRLQQEKKLQKKRLEMELLKELKKPVDDMRLKDLKDLPTLNRIPGLKLPAKAFSEILMVFEFLNNFGETLGFDMDSLPTLNSMQLALLNMDEASEEELINILQHLLVCAIEDPGLSGNSPVATVMGQKLKDVQINSFNLSEVLRLYFKAFVEHGPSSGPEVKIYRCLERNKPFLSLPPTIKAEILAFLSNELLCNQAIVKQLEENIETVATLRKDKWIVDCDLRRFKGIKTKREKKAEEEAEKEKLKEQTKEGEETSATDSKPNKKEEVKEEEDFVKKIDYESDRESGGEEENVPSLLNDQDEEPEMSNEEVDKKVDKLSRQCTLVTNKLNKAVNVVRVTCLGQDRFRRRFWVLPAAGGVFVEGMESGEPDELQNNEPGDEEDEEEEETKMMATVKKENTASNSINGDSITMNGVSEVDSEQNSQMEVKSEDSQTKPDKRNGFGSTTDTPLVATGVFDGKEANGEKSPPHASQGLPFPLINTPKKSDGKPWFSLLPREPCCRTILNIPSNHEQSPINGEVDSQDSKSMDTRTIDTETTVDQTPKTIQDIFNHLNSGGSIDASILASMEELGDVCPSLQKKLAQQREEQHEEPKKIPPDHQYGWWVTDSNQLKGLMDLLHERGVRERSLVKHIQKYLPYITTKCKTNAAEFDVTELDRKIYEQCSYGAPRDTGRYSKEVALRIDVSVIEEIEALEDKISSSSMQVRGWKPSLKIVNDPNISFKRKLASLVEDDDDNSVVANGVGEDYSEDEEDEDEEDEEENGDEVDTLCFAKERLLCTEAMIERRYLKPPLGFKSNTIVVSSGSTDELAENAADENAPSGLLRWRDAVRECSTTAQLALLVNFLESCIAWDKSIMRASCQFCSSGENEAQLLLCDGCDKGYHMYCFKPKMEEVPDGDWFCFECQNKNTIDKVCIVCGKKGKLLNCETCPKVFHPNCIDPPVSKPPKGKWSCHICVRKPKKMSKSMPKRSAASSSFISSDKTPAKETPTSTPNATPKETKKTAPASKNKKEKQKVDKEEVVSQENEEEKEKETPKGKKEKKSKEPKSNSKKDKEASEIKNCVLLLSEMVQHQDSWPFKAPVNTRKFPTYKSIVKKPMDLQTMKKALDSASYKTRKEFYEDALLVFKNCEAFNEDESPVGVAGHSLRDFFDRRWKELFHEQKP